MTGVRAHAADSWRPNGIDDLEPAAWKVVRSTVSSSVTAGPGAGKTELLAQRAAYLLQTGVCPHPQRILAISYKRDAAANLGNRVRSRVPEHARRFESMTFDAFTKGLLDRFRLSLPTTWAMPGGYVVEHELAKNVRAFLDDLRSQAPPVLQRAIRSFDAKTFLPRVVGRWDLPLVQPEHLPVDPEAFTVLAWWRHSLTPAQPRLDFVMINRLAELLVRATPRLRRALRLTYPFVFVDEFQDTTPAQLSFLRSLFTASPEVADRPAITIVGDLKQRIMGFAGALPNAFGSFAADFAPEEHELTWNFRSSDSLVEFQHTVACRLDASTTRAISKVQGSSANEPISLWIFDNRRNEARTIAKWIADDIATSNRIGSDFALVARQRVGDLDPLFNGELARCGIRLRNDDATVGEMKLQNLLKNEIAQLIVGLLRLAATPTGLPQIWMNVTAAMGHIRGTTGDEVATRTLSDELTHMVKALRSWLDEHPPAEVLLRPALKQAVEAIGVSDLRRVSRDHELPDILNSIDVRLHRIADPALGWSALLEAYEAADAVSLLTVHRSKGLEYHTVFFLGLDDDQWWAHDRDVQGSTSAFFVGLSRAAQRLIFTSTSPTARTGKIADLYELLDQAGVKGRVVTAKP
ncbi:UvrD-helicase domain-containing protein [Nonomuraea sp. NPDC050540]|uniref:UvrD-helicase domain-containing protein n=1 Tax=Nonomuraea sp. NPDC050540 TaxID=3364367 RepID=UPI0037BC2D82